MLNLVTSGFFFSGVDSSLFLSEHLVLVSYLLFEDLKHFRHTGLYDYSPPINSNSSESTTLSVNAASLEQYSHTAVNLVTF